MTQLFSADLIIPVKGAPIKNGVIETDHEGTIIRLYTNSNGLAKDKIQYFKGIIVPGFINAHCHVELSHMKGKIPKGTGLFNFIKNVMGERADSDENIQNSMLLADEEMEKNGIVAVGDHVNSNHSIDLKKKSKIYYHTFIELLGINPATAENIYKKSEKLGQEFVQNNLPYSITPHAPYSVSKDLFRVLKKNSTKDHASLSVHNQESKEENAFFRGRGGKLIDFYKTIQFDPAEIPVYNKSSLMTYAPWLEKTKKVQFVHNTFTNVKDVHLTNRIGMNCYWCFCPSANLYIENHLPNVQLFHSMKEKITLGTDSLASNEALSIVKELLILQDNFPEIALNDTIKWATLNGAEFLGIAEQFGSLEAGKKPGLVLITEIQNEKLSSLSVSKRLI